MLASIGATLIAIALGVLSALSKWLDMAIGVLIDLTMALPHLVLVIMISFALGGGTKGVIIAVCVSHWPGLARLVRAEVRRVLSADYVQVSRLLGRSGWQVAARHVLPHVLPQALVGAVLLFPHAILRESAVTFLGFGLEPHLPATGVLLSESMRYITAGWWWLGVLPEASVCCLWCSRSSRWPWACAWCWIPDGRRNEAGFGRFIGFVWLAAACKGWQASASTSARADGLAAVSFFARKPI